MWKKSKLPGTSIIVQLNKRAIDKMSALAWGTFWRRRGKKDLRLSKISCSSFVVHMSIYVPSVACLLALVGRWGSELLWGIPAHDHTHQWTVLRAKVSNVSENWCTEVTFPLSISFSCQSFSSITVPLDKNDAINWEVQISCLCATKDYVWVGKNTSA